MNQITKVQSGLILEQQCDAVDQTLEFWDKIGVQGLRYDSTHDTIILDFWGKSEIKVASCFINKCRNLFPDA